jgi:hypothetical protein
MSKMPKIAAADEKQMFATYAAHPTLVCATREIGSKKRKSRRSLVPNERRKRKLDAARLVSSVPKKKVGGIGGAA